MYSLTTKSWQPATYGKEQESYIGNREGFENSQLVYGQNIERLKSLLDRKRARGTLNPKREAKITNQIYDLESYLGREHTVDPKLLAMTEEDIKQKTRDERIANRIRAKQQAAKYKKQSNK